MYMLKETIIETYRAESKPVVFLNKRNAVRIEMSSRLFDLLGHNHMIIWKDLKNGKREWYITRASVKYLNKVIKFLVALDEKDKWPLINEMYHFTQDKIIKYGKLTYKEE